MMATQPTFPDAYVTGALQSACSASGTAGNGTRNDTLNRETFGMGQLVGAGALPRQEAEAILFGAAETCGLVRDKGHGPTRATIKSGLAAPTARKLPKH